MKEKKHLLIASFANAVISWLLFAVILSNINNSAFTDTLLTPYVILMAVTAGACSYLGFIRKQIKANNEFH